MSSARKADAQPGRLLNSFRLPGAVAPFANIDPSQCDPIRSSDLPDGAGGNLHLQLALDMAVATTTPMGYGHVFAHEHYVDAWLAVTDPQGWSTDQIARLKQYLAARARM